MAPSPDCSLIELRPGVFVFAERNDGDAPVRYYCRHCLDAGTKVTLERIESIARIEHLCPRCAASFLEKIKPISGLAFSPWDAGG